MDFEVKAKKLEAIVEKLDAKGVTLADSIALFEDGVSISKECIDILNESKGKITAIRKKMDEIFEQPFNPLDEE